MIAISGAKGFVGSALLQALPPDLPVIKIVSGTGYHREGDNLEIGFDHSRLGEALGDVKVFINAAGKVRGSYEVLKASNEDAVQRFARLLPETLEHVIHISSISVFFRERSDYGKTKMLGEHAWQASPFSDRLTILRPGLIYRQGDRQNTYALIRWVQRFPIVPLPSPARLRPVFIQDLTDLVIRLAADTTGKEKTWVVSGKEKTTYASIAEMIARHLGLRRRFLVMPRRLLSSIRSAFNIFGLNNLASRIENLQRDKNWHDAQVWELLPRPVVKLEDGLRLAVTQYLLENRQN